MLRHRVGADSWLYCIRPPERQTCPSSYFVHRAFVSFVINNDRRCGFLLLTHRVHLRIQIRAETMKPRKHNTSHPRALAISCREASSLLCLLFMKSMSHVQCTSLLQQLRHAKYSLTCHCCSCSTYHVKSMWQTHRQWTSHGTDSCIHYASTFGPMTPGYVSDSISRIFGPRCMLLGARYMGKLFSFMLSVLAREDTTGGCYLAYGGRQRESTSWSSRSHALIVTQQGHCFDDVSHRVLLHFK